MKKESNSKPLKVSRPSAPPGPLRPPTRDIEFIQSIQSLKIEKGDIIVLKVPEHLPSRAIYNIKEWVGRILGPDIKIMILEAGIDIGVLRGREEYHHEGAPEPHGIITYTDGTKKP